MSEEASAVPPKISPFGAAAPEASETPAPAAVEASVAAAPAAAPTIRLKPVIRKPVIRKPVVGGAAPAAAPAAPAAAAAEAPAVKKATQNLKSVTGPIPAQATLRKTGIISEGILTPEQAQAAKSRTSRISLESAIGAAPAKEAPAPLKTIRLRRPGDLKPSPLKPSPLKPAAPAAAEAPVADMPPAEPANLTPVAEEPSATTEATTTQKRTLKLQRPGGGLKRPSLNAAAAPAPAAGDGVADIADIPDIKPLNPIVADSSNSGDTVAAVPKAVATISLVAGIAAVLVLGAVMYFLYLEGCAPDAGPNSMAFLNI